MKNSNSPHDFYGQKILNVNRAIGLRQGITRRLLEKYKQNEAVLTMKTSNGRKDQNRVA